MRTVLLIDENMQWATAEDAYLDADGVQKFLEGFNSWLKLFKVAHDIPFSKWFWDKAIEHGIEPIMGLAMMQKEQSLIQKWQYPARPSQEKLDWACGYGCPETGGRKEEFRGFEKQIDLMLGSFQRYIDGGKKWPSIANWQNTAVALYKDGGRLTGEKVLAGNLETALHLLYNPRVDGDGVSLLKTIWDRYYEKAQKLNLVRGDVE